ncbi:hypothetical protein [Microcoleus sp. D2_18a_B4]|uniref:hypothetical protein n=1 Tax=Microcoleus sp. D2_18a_B4 TaxID=3055329 RepID=UPI002FD5061B
MNSQQSTVNSQQSTVNSQQSTVNSQQSTPIYYSDAKGLDIKSVCRMPQQPLQPAFRTFL